MTISELQAPTYEAAVNITDMLADTVPKTWTYQTPSHPRYTGGLLYNGGGN